MGVQLPPHLGRQMSDMEGDVRDLQGLVTSNEWTDVVFAANFGNYAVSFPYVQYETRGDGWVNLRGVGQAVTARAAGSTLFTIDDLSVPVAGTTEIFLCWSNVGPCRVDVASTGLVKNQTAIGAGDIISFSGVRWRIS